MKYRNEVFDAIAQATEAANAPTRQQRIAKAMTPEQYSDYLNAEPDPKPAPVAKAVDAFEATIVPLAKQLQQSDTTLTQEQAVAKLLKENPALYDALLVVDAANRPAATVTKAELMAEPNARETIQKRRLALNERRRRLGFDAAY